MTRVAQPAQQVPGHGGGRALALGPGDAHDPRPVGLLQPQAQAADDRRAPGLDALDLGAVAADPRGLDHHVAAQRGRRGRRPPWPGPGGRRRPRRAAGRRRARARRRARRACGRWPGPRRRGPRPRPPGRGGQTRRSLVAYASGMWCSPAGWRMASTASGVGSRSPSRSTRARSTGVARRSGRAGGQGDRGPALVDVADALPRLEGAGRVDQRLEAGEQVEVVERLAPAEHLGEPGGGAGTAPGSGR